MREDLAWAAGFWEGEGCFTISKNTDSSTWSSPQAVLVNTDLDRLEKLAAVVGFGKIKPITLRSERHKPRWKWLVTDYEHVQAVIAMLWPWLGSRRRDRAAEVLQLARSNPRSVRCRRRAQNALEESKLVSCPSR